MKIGNLVCTGQLVNYVNVSKIQEVKGKTGNESWGAEMKQRCPCECMAFNINKSVKNNRGTNLHMPIISSSVKYSVHSIS